ncbi:hypothetical protein ACIREE_28475 [Streptomyces sp. NPDC102467]|uniref:hypothetical protein n=1 Tax=Streptomyces sp. NPDC102467 TaxID=3366179 RepID=UPI00381CE7C1
MIEALDHVQLAAPVSSEALLRAFYIDVLGMTETPKPPALGARGGCWFEAAAQARGPEGLPLGGRPRVRRGCSRPRGGAADRYGPAPLKARLRRSLHRWDAARSAHPRGAGNCATSHEEGALA